MTPGPGIEPGPHWWKASALTTAPTPLPNQCKCMKIPVIMCTAVERYLIIESFTQLCKQNSKSVAKTRPEKIQAWKGFELMTIYNPGGKYSGHLWKYVASSNYSETFWANHENVSINSSTPPPPPPTAMSLGYWIKVGVWWTRGYV